MKDIQTKLKQAEQALGQGRLEVAEDLLEEVLSSAGLKPEDQAKALLCRGRLHYHLRRYPEAISDLRNSVELFEAYDHAPPHLLDARMLLAGAMIASGEVEAGCQLGRETFQMMESRLPADSSAIGKAAFLLSQGEYALRNLDAAEALTRRALAVWRKTQGSESIGVSTCLNNLGRIYEERAQPETGVSFHREAVAIRRKILGEHPETAFTLGNLGTALAACGEWEEAAKALEECLAIYSKAGITTGPQIDGYRHNLEVCRNATADPDAEAFR